MATTLKLRNLSIIAILLLTIVSCSFRKTPLEQSPIESETQSQKIKISSAEELINTSSTDEEILESILSEKNQNPNTPLHELHPNLLDSAFNSGRSQIMEFLILNGFSPFVISESSYRKLEYDRSGRVIISGQMDKIFELLRIYPSKDNAAGKMAEFKKQLEELKLGPRGCEKIVQTVFEIRYYSQSKDQQNSYMAGFENIPTNEAITLILSDTECGKHVSSFSIISTQEWLGLEFMLQFQKNFTNIIFIKWLTHLFPVSSIKITVPNRSNIEGPIGSVNPASQVRVDPTALVLLKMNCLGDGKLLNDWIELAKDLRGASDSYSFPIELIDLASEISYCKKIAYQLPPIEIAQPTQARCETLLQSLSLSYGLLIDHDSSQFKDWWIGQHVSEENNKKFRDKVCGGGIK